MNIFKEYLASRKSLKEVYSKDDLSLSITTPLSFTIIFALPLILIDIALFQLLVSLPYLCFILTGVFLIWILLFYFVSRITFLKKVQIVDSINYKALFIVPLLISVSVVLLLDIVLMFTLVPVFFM